MISRRSFRFSSMRTMNFWRKWRNSGRRGGCGRALMKERFGAKDPRSMMLRFHAQTAGSSLTAQQPENNIVRVAIQALGAVLGGCQSLHANGARRSAGAAD